MSDSNTEAPATSAAPTTEAPKTETQETAAPATEKKGAEYSSWKRKELEYQAAVKAHQTKAEQAQSQLEEKLALLQLLDEDPEQFWEKSGKKYEDVTRRMIFGKPKVEPIDAVSKRIQELEEKLAAKEKAEVDAQESAFTKEVESQTTSILDEILAKPEYDLVIAQHGVRDFDAYEEIMDMVWEADKKGIELGLDEAAMILQKGLEKDLTAKKDKLSSSKTLRSLIGAVDNRDTAQTGRETLSKDDSSRQGNERQQTLKNSQSSVIPDRTPQEDGFGLSIDARVERELNRIKTRR